MGGATEHCEVDWLSQINSLFGLVAMRQHTPWKCHILSQPPLIFWRMLPLWNWYHCFRVCVCVCVCSPELTGYNKRLNTLSQEIYVSAACQFQDIHWTSPQHMAVNDVQRWKAVHPGPKPDSRCWQLVCVCVCVWDLFWMRLESDLIQSMSKAVLGSC